MNPELHRPIDRERIPTGGLDVTVEADPRECAALADRMGVPAVAAVRCDLHLAPDSATTVVAHGHLRATVTRVCIVSLEEFDTTVEERFQVRFVPSGTESEDDDPNSIDEIPYEDRIIDLGEAVAEQLGLALDPYPRMPGVELPEEATEGLVNPFAALTARLPKS